LERHTVDELDNTLTTRLFAPGGTAGPMLGLTILWHPDLERIGDQYIGPPGAGVVEVSRYAPLFFRPGRDGLGLGHRAIARSPLLIQRDGKDQVLLVAPDSKMALDVNGAPFSGERLLDSEDIGRGVVLGLGGHVLLCLHWMRSFPKANALPGLLGVSSAAIGTRDLIRQVAGTDLPVLLLGETGTGKDVAARAIHAASKRNAQPLVAVNMATLSESLAAADLFGATRGAYTGAQTARQGLFAEADGGTLCLEDLDARGFNQPLLRRMEAFVIRVAPLRERREDIGLLWLHFLNESAASAEEIAAIPPHFVSEVCNADWPGNVRQLNNVARRALMAMRAGEAPQLAQFVHATRPSSAQALPDVPEAPAVMSQPRKKLADLGNEEVLEAMESNGWQISGAAQQLGISRPSLYKLLEAHPAIRPAALIPAEEISGVLRAHNGDLALCASQLKTPSEALRRHLRVLGLDAQP
jgi:hypothetical protein